MEKLIWLIPALPLAGFLVQLLLGRRLGEPKAGFVATAFVGASFVTTVAVFIELLNRSHENRAITQQIFEWIPAGNLHLGMGFLADPLSITMCLFVTGIGALIHLYSVGYMHGDPKFSKFFLYLNLFVFSMLILVLGNNLMVTFMGWEGVGACSYFLIAFWHTDPANASAGKKAFVTNRVGDFGFMLAVFLTWGVVGSLNYLDVNAAATGGVLTGVTATAIAALFLLAATGKSAQLPLFVWLPDAMAGPTPVSALIHAATMVTSGVYLLVRLNPVLAYAGWANDVIAWIGVITALVAATIAVAQNDIKKVLAYSTVSQLGFLFLAVGTGHYVAAIFHMVTHAFFKALMFLGSGSVILGMEHDQDMRHYGNLRKYMPITAITFIIGWLAIAGVPPFSGFWSKDEILAGAFGAHGAGKLMWFVGLIAALLTAFYMSRLVFLTFFGEEKWRQPATTDAALATADLGDHAGGAEHDAHGGAADHADPAHGDHHGLTPDHTPRESPWTMTVPLVVLAGLALVGGALNLPFANSLHFLDHWLEPVIAHPHELPAGGTLVVLAIIATLIALGGIALAALVYLKRRLDARALEPEILAKGWCIDQAYADLMGGPGRRLFDAVAWFDRTVIDGAVNGTGAVVNALSVRARRFQSGELRGYALALAAGAVLLVAYFMTRMGI
jgi:NADH-quinone oxidoreductase subunit L